MNTYKITHTPFTTGEPHTIAEGLGLDEAKAWLAERARRLQKRIPSADINWDQPVAMGYEVTDDKAYAICDYQGRTQIVREKHE